MARGRFISKCITSDKRIHELSSDTCRLAFTWLITFADAEGRVHGDPLMVRSMLFPRREDITPEQMEGYIQEWATAELITWYKANGDKWIQFNNFEKHQLGLRKDREPDSDIPKPNDADIIRQSSVNLPSNIPLNIKLSKVKEEVKVKLIGDEKKSPDNHPEEIQKEETPKENTTQQEMVRVLSEATGLDYHIKQNAGRLAKVGGELLKAGYTSVEVLSYYTLKGWWQQCDWRGLQGQYPTPEQVLQTISIARKGIIKPTGKMTAQEKTLAAFDRVEEELIETGGVLSWPHTVKP